MSAWRGDAAQWYAQKGIAVLPCYPREKRPLTRHGVRDASTDSDQIRSWWTRWPDANVGIALGVSGVAVLDIDSAQAAAELAALEAELGELPAGPRTITSRGEHRWFHDPGIRLVSHLGAIEVRHGDRYVLAPPSVHPDGPEYKFADSKWRQPARLPEAWRLRLAAPPAPPPARAPERRRELPTLDSARIHAYGLAALEDECDELARCTPGGRNERLSIAAYNLGRHVGAGSLDYAGTVAALIHACSANGLLDEPQERAKTHSTIERRLADGIRMPRYPQEETYE